MNKISNIKLGIGTYWDTYNKSITINDSVIKLSKSMNNCLELLVKDIEKPLDSERIFYFVWGTNKEFNNKAIRTLISNIRKKIPTINIENYYGGFYSLKKHITPTPDFQEYLLDILNQAKNGIVLTDPNQDDNPVIYVNDVFVDLFGYTADEVIGHNCRFLHGEDREQKEIKQIKEAIKAQKSICVVTKNYHKSGRLIYNEIQISPIFDKKSLKIKYFLGVQKDVTQTKIKEEKLEFEKAKLDLIIQSLPDLLWIKDKDGFYLNCNERFENFFGKKRKEIIGKKDYDFVDEKLADFFRKNDKKAMESDTPVSNFELLPYPDGHKEYVQTTKTKVELSDGTIYGVLGISRNITELKNLQEKLLKAQEIAKFGSYTFDIKNDKWESSSQLNNIFGINDNYKKTTQSWLNIIHDDYKNQMKEYLQNNIINNKESFDKTYKIIDQKTQEEKWVHGRGEVLTDDEGTAISLYGIIQDITFQKQNEYIIQSQKEEFETIFNYSHDSIAIIDLDGNFLNCNQAFLELTGFSKNELITKNYRNLTLPEDIERNNETLQKAIKDGHIDSFVNEYIIKNGNKVSVNLSISLLPDKKRVLLTITDITKLKILEEQTKLASMGEMIGNIAHQWRQPLNIITTSISGLKLKSDISLIDDKDIEDCTKHIIKQANYLSNTIENFRNFIKKDNLYAKVSLKNVVENTLELVKASLENNYIKLILDIENNLEIMGSKNELTEALVNIINNSKDILKTKEEDNRLLFILTKKISTNKINLIIYDNAGGIEKENIEKVFIPYFTTKHQSQGTGLGLAITDKIIRERHKGTITVQNKEFEYNSKIHKGACFNILFENY